MVSVTPKAIAIPNQPQSKIIQTWTNVQVQEAEKEPFGILHQDVSQDILSSTKLIVSQVLVQTQETKDAN